MEHNTTTIPDLTINVQQNLARGLGKANKILQLGEWAHAMYFSGAIIDDETGKALKYRDQIKTDKYKNTWSKSLANEIRRLAQGIREIVGTNTMFFVRKSDMPKSRWRDIMYVHMVVAYRLHNTKPHQSRLTVGGDSINHPYDVSTPTADLKMIKMMWSSTLSTKDAKFITMDVANFYLGTPMIRPEFMRLTIKIIPQEIIDKYNLDATVEDGGVYARMVKGMYGFLQAGILANSLLGKILIKARCYQCKFTPGLWRNAWQPIT